MAISHSFLSFPHHLRLSQAMNITKNILMLWALVDRALTKAHFSLAKWQRGFIPVSGHPKIPRPHRPMSSVLNRSTQLRVRETLGLSKPQRNGQSFQQIIFSINLNEWVDFQVLPDNWKQYSANNAKLTINYSSRKNACSLLVLIVIWLHNKHIYLTNLSKNYFSSSLFFWSGLLLGWFRRSNQFSWSA